MNALPLDPRAAGMALHLALRGRYFDGLRPDDSLDALDLYLEDATVVRHFTAREIVQLSTHDGVKNTVPTPLLWHNIVPTLLVCEWLRAQFGKPVVVNSGYRSDAYNRAVGGSPKSLHRKFNALDIRTDGITPELIARKLETHTEAHLMGVGLYDSFVHLDLRGMLGLKKARWDLRTPRAA